MNDNLALWNAVDDIDPKFTKKITGKPYQGTSPNPQYLIKMATEQFGPVGKGFGWKVLEDKFVPLESVVLHNVRIAFWWKDEDGRHEFEEYGGTIASRETNAGKALVDEDVGKKSLTDALVKALSHLGFAANIFLGRWDDQKYVAEVNAEFRAAEKAGGPMADSPELAHEPEPQAPQDGPEAQYRMALDTAQSKASLDDVAVRIKDDPALDDAAKKRLRIVYSANAHRIEQLAKDFAA